MSGSTPFVLPAHSARRGKAGALNMCFKRQTHAKRGREPFNNKPPNLGGGHCTCKLRCRSECLTKASTDISILWAQADLLRSYHVPYIAWHTCTRISMSHSFTASPPPWPCILHLPRQELTFGLPTVREGLRPPRKWKKFALCLRLLFEMLRCRNSMYLLLTEYISHRFSNPSPQLGESTM
jgi:hypothetical protein